MYKIGDTKLLGKNKFLIPPKLFNISMTLICLFLPAIIDAILIQFNYYKEQKAGLFISIILYIFVAIQVIRCACTEPGLVPNKQMYDQLIKSINKQMNLTDEQEYDYSTTKNQFYKALTYKPSNMITLNVQKNNHRLCSTCETYKGQRVSHSSRTNMCTMRMDHYCPWVGSDIGLRNHWLFYQMVTTIITYIVIVLIIQITYLVLNIQSIIDNHTAMKWIELGFHILFILAASYFIYSISVLINYHRNLLKTGTLTKEYLGSQIQNLQISGQYDAGNIKENFNTIKYNYFYFKNYSLMNQFYQLQEYLLNIIQNNNIKNWNQLQQYVIDKSTPENLYILELENLSREAFEFVDDRDIRNNNQFDYQFIFLNNQSDNKYIIQYKQQMQKYIQRLQQLIKQIQSSESPYQIRYKQIETQTYCYMILYDEIDKLANFIPYQNRQKADKSHKTQNQLKFYLFSPMISGFVSMNIMIKQIRQSEEEVSKKIQQLEKLPVPELCKFKCEFNKQNNKQIEMQENKQETIIVEEEPRENQHQRRQAQVYESPLDIENIISE